MASSAETRPMWLREWHRVRVHVRHSKARGLGCSLTSVQWIETLEHFQRCCAFCCTPLGDAGTITLDHYRPQVLGGGTVVYNVLPICPPCQREKDNLPPEAWKGMLRRAGDRERLRRVELAEAYLAHMREEVRERWQSLRTPIPWSR